MNVNVGNTDRIVRIVLGLLVLSLVVVGPQTAWGFLGLIPLVTGLFGRCAIYSMLGMSSVKRSA